MEDIEKVLHFWFGKKNNPRKSSFWFKKDKKFDSQIKNNFKPLLLHAKKGALTHWETTPKSTLALIILLDQFSRNIYRSQKKSYEADTQAQKVALRGVRKGFDLKLSKKERGFFICHLCMLKIKLYKINL